MKPEKIQRLDSELYVLAKKFRVLEFLAWPQGEDQKFLKHWDMGNPKLPNPDLKAPDQKDLIRHLEQFKKQCNQDEPIERYLWDTAESYVLCGKMLTAIGTKSFTDYSARIYGLPDDHYKTQTVTTVDAATFLLDVSEDLLNNDLIPKTRYDITPQDFADWIKDEIDLFFGKDKIQVKIDKSISARALASSKVVKISDKAKFSELDKQQLLNHEAYIHAGTMLNGKEQPLKCLSLGSPRTTRTQEGLAVMSEITTLTMGLTRLRRIALRIMATKMALDGADFIEVFKYFMQEGQTKLDAVHSTQRIFRGGDVKGGIVFTKDTVYLKGLYEVHTFMRLAASKNRTDYIQNLFTGRLAIKDVISLAHYYKEGWLLPPKYIPYWAQDFRILTTTMAFSAFMSNISLKNLTFDDFLNYDGH